MCVDFSWITIHSGITYLLCKVRFFTFAYTSLLAWLLNLALNDFMTLSFYSEPSKHSMRISIGENWNIYMNRNTASMDEKIFYSIGTKYSNTPWLVKSSSTIPWPIYGYNFFTSQGFAIEHNFTLANIFQCWISVSTILKTNKGIAVIFILNLLSNNQRLRTIYVDGNTVTILKFFLNLLSPMKKQVKSTRNIKY